MKKLILVIATVLSYSLWAGNEISELNVPQKVSKSFRDQYPNVQNIVWEKVDSNYEVSYTDHNNRLFVVSYDKTGIVKRMDREIDVAELPEVHVAKIRDLYANDYKILKVMLKDYTAPTPVYLVMVQNKTFYYKFVFETQDTEDHILQIQRIDEVD